MAVHLRALREILGLTVDEVAARADTSSDRVRRVEERFDACPDDAERILAVFGLDPVAAADDAVAPDEDLAGSELFFFKGESTVLESDDLTPLSEGLRWARLWASSVSGSGSQERRRAVHPEHVRGDRPAAAAWHGYALAQFIRRRLGCTSEPLSSVREIAEDTFGIPVITGEFRSSGLRAAAIVARARSAAAIVVRDPGPDEGARVRVDIAHELCHALFDHLDPGRATLALDHDSFHTGKDLTEPRARGFAAELLVPRAGLYEFLGTPDHLGGKESGMERVRRCCECFAAPPKLVTHHLYNHGYLSSVTHERLKHRYADLLDTLVAVDIEAPDVGAPPICITRAADENWGTVDDPAVLAAAAEQTWARARIASVLATVKTATGLDASGDGALAGLVLSRLGDAALRSGDRLLLRELFESVEAANLSSRPIRALLTNTRAAGLVIPARQRLIEQVCEARRSRGHGEIAVAALRERLA